jgi:hypothetical protein
MIRPTGAPPSAQVIPLQSAVKPRAETPVVVARHGGRCSGCRGAIRLDEEIQRVERGWHHVECIPWETIPFAPRRREDVA